MNDEIPTVPPGSISTEQDGDDVFLLLHDASLIASSFASSGNSVKSRSSSLNMGLDQGFFGFDEGRFFCSAFFPQLFIAINLSSSADVAW